MVDFQTMEIAGFLPALEGMRMPLKSYKKQDTEIQEDGQINVGPNDYALANKLVTAGGSEHAKFLRQIQVWVKVTAPRFFFQEMSTYKVGTTENSESTMHTLMRDGLTEEDICFQFEENDNGLSQAMRDYIRLINTLIQVYKYKGTSFEKNQIFEKVKAMLPEGFIQTRMVSLNYEVLRNMYRQRKNHRLSGWNTDFVNWIHSLPMHEWITEEFPKKEISQPVKD